MEKMTKQTEEDKNFMEYNETNPCDDCPAHCCRMVIIPYDAPLTFMQMDYILLMLGFPNVKMLLTSKGEWKVKIEQDCGFLDSDKGLCTLHDHDKKPKTCHVYNAYHCWYKHNFGSDSRPDIIQFDLNRFKKLGKYVTFSDDGHLVTIPSWDNLRELLGEG